MKVYPCGYARSPEWIEHLMHEHPHLMMIDTRFTPWSNRPAWRGETLRATYGERYRWAGQFLGNRHYKSGGPVDLVDPVRGLAGLRHWLEHEYDLLLLCGCADYSRCHRKTIVEALRADVPDIEVVMPPEPASSAETSLALSIRQPWTWLLTHPAEVAACGLPPKTLENRTWSTRYRGPLLLHAGATLETAYFERRSGLLLPDYWTGKFGAAGARLAQIMPRHRGDYATGAVVGYADLVDVVQSSPSPWFVGPYGFMLDHARAITPPVNYPGSRKLFAVPDLPAFHLGEEARP